MITIISNQIELRKQQKRVPYHVLLSHVIIETNKLGIEKQQAIDKIEELEKSDKIIIGRTINDNYLKLK